MSVVSKGMGTLDAHRGRILGIGYSTVAVVALVDWLVASNLSIGFVYILPIALLGTVTRPWQIVATAGLCTLMREAFASFAFHEGWPARLALVILIFCSVGLLSSQVNANQRMLGQLRALVDTSPLAVLIAGAEGRLLLANESARRLFGIPEPGVGRHIGAYLPALAGPIGALPGVRTEIECQGRDSEGGEFLAHVWFSVCGSGPDRRLQAMVWDASEEFFDHCLGTFTSVATSSQVVAAALAHEVRNLAGAARKLVENGSAGGPPLLDVLRSLENLGAAGFLQPSQAAPPVDPGPALAQAHLLLRDLLEGSGIELEWDVPASLPAAGIDPSVLLQVLLNLVNNAREALRETPAPRISVHAGAVDRAVTIRVGNNGPEVAEPGRLFRPFAPGANGTGLGLYLSRTLLRGQGGDLRYDPSAEGSSFTIELAAAKACGATA